VNYLKDIHLLGVNGDLRPRTKIKNNVTCVKEFKEVLRNGKNKFRLL